MDQWMKLPASVSVVISASNPSAEFWRVGRELYKWGKARSGVTVSREIYFFYTSIPPESPNLWFLRHGRDAFLWVMCRGFWAIIHLPLSHFFLWSSPSPHSLFLTTNLSFLPCQAHAVNWPSLTVWPSWFPSRQTGLAMSMEFAGPHTAPRGGVESYTST